MSQKDNNTKKPSGKHLTLEKRQVIEYMYKAKMSAKEMAKAIGCSEKTIRRELKRGMVTIFNSDYTTRREYSALVAQAIHDYLCTNKGPDLKIGNDYKLVEFIEKKIKEEKMSPYAVAEEIKKHKDEFSTTLSFKTIYNYIEANLFIGISNKDLPVKKNGKKRNYSHIRRAMNNQKGTSISERPESIETREEFGNWEMDTVVGKKKTKTVLLVLTERKTRQEIIRKIPSKSQQCVVDELNKIESIIGTEAFATIFKTITCDNGCENLDFEGIEKSNLSDTQRTEVFYAHPYCSWERGSNENANKLIRRFIQKGADISKFSDEEIKQIESWINNYPRRSFKGLSSNEMLKKCSFSLPSEVLCYIN